MLDSFAAGLPCVMTPVAAEGLTLDRVLRSAGAIEAVAGVGRVRPGIQGAAQEGPYRRAATMMPRIRAILAELGRMLPTL